MNFQAVMKLTQTSTMVNLRISRNKSRRISTESSERTDHLRTDDSTTSVDSEVYESTIKGITYDVFIAININFIFRKYIELFKYIRRWSSRVVRSPISN